METNQTTMEGKNTIPMRTIALREDLLKEENKIISSFDFSQIGDLAKVAISLCEYYYYEEVEGLYRHGLTEVETVINAIRKLLEGTEEWTAELLSDIDTIKKTNLP